MFRDPSFGNGFQYVQKLNSELSLTVSVVWGPGTNSHNKCMSIEEGESLEFVDSPTAEVAAWVDFVTPEGDLVQVDLIAREDAWKTAEPWSKCQTDQDPTGINSYCNCDEVFDLINLARSIPVAEGIVDRVRKKYAELPAIACFVKYGGSTLHAK